MATTAFLNEYTGVLMVEACYKCGVPFGMDSAYHRKRVEDHADFYCPNGHAQHYLGKSEADKAKEEAARQQHVAELERARAESWKREAQAAQRSAAANRGVVTRIKRRVSKGVCPCCSRHFADLQRHMQGQHPEYPADES